MTAGFAKNYERGAFTSLLIFRGKTSLTTEGSRWLTKHGFQSILQNQLFQASHCPLVNFSGFEQSKKIEFLYL